MRIIRRLAVVLSAIAMAIPSMSADDGAKVYIHFNNGEKMELDFADRPTISFNSKNALKIQSAAMSMKVKAFSTVDRITFSDQAGIDDIAADGAQINTEKGNKVAFLGFKEGTKVSVIGVDGIVYMSATIDDENRFELSLDRLGKGVYLVAADKEICKLVIH